MRRYRKRYSRKRKGNYRKGPMGTVVRSVPRGMTMLGPAGRNFPASMMTSLHFTSCIVMYNGPNTNNNITPPSTPDGKLNQFYVDLNNLKEPLKTASDKANSI